MCLLFGVMFENAPVQISSHIREGWGGSGFGLCMGSQRRMLATMKSPPLNRIFFVAAPNLSAAEPGRSDRTEHEATSAYVAPSTFLGTCRCQFVNEGPYKVSPYTVKET